MYQHRHQTANRCCLSEQLKHFLAIHYQRKRLNFLLFRHLEIRLQPITIQRRYLQRYEHLLDFQMAQLKMLLAILGWLLQTQLEQFL